ncbi:unnamed protein product [Sphagnum troendelagicum]
MDFDTWEEFTLVGGVDSEPEGTKQKPIHKLAARGKTEMVRLILDNCDIDPDYVNTVVPEVFDETPLYYVVQGDHVETMNFLLERGGSLVMESVKLYHSSIYGYGRGVVVKKMLDLVIGHGFNIEAAMKLKVHEVQQLLLDEDSHDDALDKTLFNGGTLLKNILIASDGHYMTLENVAQWSDNKELFDYLVDLQLKQEVVSSGNESQATGLGSQSKQLYQEKSASEGEAYTQRILSGFETGSAPEEVISIHYNIDFPHELSVECCKRVGMSIISHGPKKKEGNGFFPVEKRCRSKLYKQWWLHINGHC